MEKTAAFFDLDKTIIATSASAALSRPFYDGGLVTRADVVRTAYAHLSYLLGSATEDSTERVRKQLSDLCQGWDRDRVHRIVTQAVATQVSPHIYAEAKSLIAEHHELGHDVVIVSASGSDLVEPIAEKLGADEVIATRMEVKDGRYTGEIEFYAYGDNKATAIEEIAAKNGYSLESSYAYTDSITDLPMLRTVGHGFVVNPDRELRTKAVEEGWGVLNFTQTDSSKSRLESNEAKALGAVGIVTLAWLVWRLARSSK
ncbi:MAG: HAD-IB family hydrolase [Cellulomonadaceae bacterium]|nr:HAD-IB family hydrolase [Cellulomonadaceae bacterium]